LFLLFNRKKQVGVNPYIENFILIFLRNKKSLDNIIYQGFLKLKVELAGVEPASEKVNRQASTCLAID